MEIIFLTLLRIEDVEVERSIYADLMRKFVKEGHNVTIVHPNEKRLGLDTQFIDKGNIKYLRVKTGNVTKSSFIEKGIATLLLEGAFKKAISKHLSGIDYDLIIYSTPPITFAKVIKYLKNKTQARSYLLLKDIFPQNAVDLKLISERSLIYKFFRYKERKLYQQSDIIGCMSQANVDYIRKHNKLDNTLIEICPNSIEVEEKCLSNGRSQFGLPEDKIIFLYGGNLGKPQGIDFLKKVILKNENKSSSFFCIVGSGTEFMSLQNFFKEQKIENSLLLKNLDKSDYDKLTSVCDVGLIFLDSNFTIPNFPSRLLSYMEFALPVLAATDEVTDIKDILVKGQFGYWCKSGDTSTFFEHVNTLKDGNLRNIMGENAHRFLMNNYTVEKSYEIIMKHFI